MDIQHLPTLTHEEQQEAVEKIQELMRQGISTGEAIQRVSSDIRAKIKKEKEKE